MYAIMNRIRAYAQYIYDSLIARWRRGHHNGVRHFYRFRRDMDKRSSTLKRRFIKRSVFKTILWSPAERDAFQFVRVGAALESSSVYRSRILSRLRRRESRIQGKEILADIFFTFLRFISSCLTILAIKCIIIYLYNLRYHIAVFN